MDYSPKWLMNGIMSGARGVLPLASIVVLMLTFLNAAPADAQSVEEIFARAERLYENKSYTLAMNDYQRIISVEPEEEMVAFCWLRIGMCNYHLGEFGLSADSFDRILVGYYYSQYTDEAAFLSAKAYFALGDYPTSTSRLLRVVYMGEKSRYYERAKRGIEDLLDTALSADELSWALDTVQPKEEVGEFLLSRAREQVDEERYSLAMVILYDLSERYSSFRFSPQVDSLLERVREKLAPLANRIGVLVPLSGDYEVYGRQVANAVTLAVQEYNQKGIGPQVELYLLDSGDTLETTKMSYRSLSDINRCIAVIGPMFTDEAVALSELTEMSRVPLLSPAAGSSDFLSGGEYLFRCAMTNRLQARVLAQYAYDELHLRRYAILYPGTDYGMELRDEFKSAVEKLGGKVVAEEEYPLADYTDKTPDYTGQVKKVKWSKPDAIYIPGSYDEIILLAPQIAFSHIPAVILGANGWDEPRVARMGAKYVEGAYFTSPFFQDTQNPLARQFITNYTSEFREKPTYIGAQAYDAARILLNIISKGVVSGEEMKNSLSEVVGFGGITGRITLRGGEDDDCVKDIVILTIKEGTILQVN